MPHSKQTPGGILGSCLIVLDQISPADSAPLVEVLALPVSADGAEPGQDL